MDKTAEYILEDMLKKLEDMMEDTVENVVST